MLRWRSGPLALLLAYALALPLGDAPAAEGGSQSDKVTKRPRDEAALTGGEIIQLETMWMPVAAPQGGRRYVGMTVQLTPHPDKMAEACYIAPWVAEALIGYFNDNPLSQGNQGELDQTALRDALLARARAVAGEGIFTKVRVFDGPPRVLEFEDAQLSLVCA